jgi:pimeloyl-ACP methyl ester carboxylesterase
VHVVRGDRDVPTVTKIAEILEKGIPGSRKAIIPGAGHIVNVEKPREFDRAVLEFVGGR